MGGHTKQSQRTKNNTKPSSSGRSAELLETSVGFGALSATGGFAPTSSGFSALSDTTYDTINSNYQVVFKKMSKKDPTTKVKALQEFSDLISNSEIEDVKLVLPFWTKIYANLAVDSEHKVREKVQQVHHVLTQKAGKNLAPHIKQLAPIWLASQYDTYAPTASIAAASFKSSFSEQKIKEVFAYCQSDILEYVTKNLFSPAASNLKSQQTTGDLDKNVQVVTGCLKLYGLYIENTLQETIEQNLEQNESLLLNSKFWDFAQQKIGCVRSAWFETLFYLLKKTEFLINKYKQRVIPLVFSHLDDKDSTVLPHVWNCILLVQILYKDWNSMIDFKKAIQPKLFSLIKSGANSNAADIYPSFLPFISNLKVDDEFYVDFFNALKNWIVQNCKHNYCKGNVAAALTAFYECLRFVTHTKNTNINQEWNYNNFMDDFVIDVIRLYFRNECIGHKIAFSNIAKLIANWTENKNDSKLYSDLLERFWSQLFTLFKDLEEIGNSEYQLTRIVDFMQSFNNLETKKEKVKFSDNSDDPSKTTERKKAEKLILQNDLKKLAIKLAKFYTEKNTTEPSEQYSNNINFLCRMFGDIEFYKTLNDGYLQTSFDTFYKFLTSEEKPHEVMVDTIFEVIKLMPEENRAECINKLLKLPNALVHQWILERMLSYPLCLEKSVKETLNQTDVTDMILKLTKESLIENSSRKYNLVKMCFFQNNSGEIVINKATVSGIINVVADILEDKKDEPGEELLDKCGNFLSQMMSVLSSNNDYQDIKSEIFIKLFKISVNAMNDISDDTFWEVTTCWQDGIAAEDVTLSKDLLMECSRIVHSKLFIDDEFILTDIEKVANMVARLVANLEEQNSNGLEVLKTFSDFNEPEMSKIWNTIQKFYCFMKCLEGESALGAIEDTIEDFSTYDVECLLKINFFNFAVNMQLLFSETESVGSSNDIIEDILEGLLKAMQICGSFSCIAETYSNVLSEKGQYILTSLGEKIQLRLSSLSEELSTSLILKSFACINENGSSGTSILNYLPHIAKYSKTGEGLKSIFKDLTKYLCDRNNFIAFVNVLQALFDKLPPRSLSEHLEIFSENEDDLIKMAGIRSIVMNNHLADFNFHTDGKLVSLCLNIIKNFASKHDKKNNFLLYNCNISTSSVDDVKKIVEFINFLRVILTAYASNLSVGEWDIVRVALSSWVLTVSNSLNNINYTKVLLFTSSVYKLFSALSKFIVQEKTKSSTELLSSVVDEWENCFALEVNLVLFKIYYNVVSLNDESLGVVSVINSISPTIEDLDFRLISTSCQKGFKLKLNDILEFSVKNLSSNLYSIRTTALIVIRKIANTLVSTDAEALRKRNEIEEQKNCNIENTDEWHHMYKFGSYLSDYAKRVEEYSNAFSYKLTELADLEKVPSSVSMPLLYTWDCIIHICSLSPAEVRSIYAFWIGKNDFEQTILHFLFRIMPVEILKNHDSKIMNTDIFKPLEWDQILDRNISTERYACHLYGQMLRHFPALVRKWWNDCYPRQKTFVDKLTTNFVSNLICQEELRSITAKREKHENMQITVHSSTREVTATYSVDEARMELVISLAPNHPLGAVKVESGKHIGGRIQSRQVVMQLTIFLTHQNGSIFDGLTLWKNNLDKKFEGVEECYVCYSVIHQDTCQLPKLSCKTCKKKFHGPCLYKWFTTSSKSTCPICRNVF